MSLDDSSHASEQNACEMFIFALSGRLDVLQHFSIDLSKNVIKIRK